MSSMDTTPSTPAPAPQATQSPAEASPRPARGGRSGLVMPLLLAAISVFLLVGAATLDAVGTEFPGPRFLPVILAVVGLVLAAILAVGAIRHPEPSVDPTTGAARPRTDLAALAWVGGGFLAFALLLTYLGWILAGALLFWCTSHGFGSRRPGFDVLLGLFLASAVYLIFGTGLGLVLPTGFLGMLGGGP